MAAHLEIVIDAVDADRLAGPNVILQQVPEGKVAKNRMHLDVHAAGTSWERMADPDGNELCVCAARD